MEKLPNLFNQQTAFIQVSDIRQFDERVSPIEGMLKLTIGEPDFNTPDHIKEAAMEAIEQNFSHYSPMAGDMELRQAATAFVAKKYGLVYDPASEIVITVGASQAIAASLSAILNPGDKVLMPVPIYPGYEPIITLNRATPVYIDTTSNHFVLTPEMIHETMALHGNEVKAIILNYPSNPTGTTYTEAEVIALADALRQYELLVISDEIYSELTYGAKHVSIAKYLREQTLLINGLSKSHAMTGWRIGFLFAPQPLMAQILKVHQYLVTSASSISQRAGIAALTTGIDDGLVMKEAYQERGDFLYHAMTQMGFAILKPSGAFYIFAKIPAGYLQNSMDFCVDVAEKVKVAMIPGSAFGEAGQGYVRLSYATSMETLREAMTRLKEYMEKCQTA
ncbi:pyridoxal phosphate-dependent aminotransferase [Isobaculum melis]|uniref:Aminotransferase n=1 Tax=Isobaculum melis TaxID=142588 RepID=A0A1H9T926_9LACT|nr:pyridoxal phosphate-dependent aminotransferase [Isobaculum melis]SER93299.1 aromatic amino acid aminotransferase apoenzyme [Isobaculum melis]